MSRRLALLFITLIATLTAMGQQSGQVIRRRVVSYNVENLFDTIDDPETDDKDFLPEGSYHWTKGRYRNKVENISRTLSRIGEWDYPALIGLVEIENVQVIRDLTDAKALRKMDYRMSVSRGADPRGIDVALLWDPKLFRRVDAHEIPHYGDLLSYPLRRDPRTKRERSGSGRNTLWVTLEQRHSGALLDVFVVHLPSRRGGVRTTSADRERVAAKIYRVIQDLYEERPDARVLIMGDFNDEPHNRALTTALRTISPDTEGGEIRPRQLYNLAAPREREGKGSHYFGRQYWLPDQIIVSGSLLLDGAPLKVSDPSMSIYEPGFLQERKSRPRRSFKGLHYTGGFSDHYPVFVDLIIDQTGVNPSEPSATIPKTPDHNL